MASNPLISVIIPVYKTEQYLNNCIGSVVNQTYTNLEIILVDDGSPDGSPKILDSWAEKDKRIKVIHKTNGGLSSARNAGIDVSSGEYVMFIDSDDIVHTQICQILFDIMVKNDAQVSCCSYKSVKSLEIKPEKYSLNEVPVCVYKGDEVFDLLYNGKVHSVMSAWAKLYKKETVCKYPDGKIHEDEYTIHHILGKTKTLVYTSLPMYFNLYRTDSITGCTFSKKRLDALGGFDNRLEYCRLNKPQYYQRTLEQRARVLASFYVKAKKSKCEKELLEYLLSEFNATYDRLQNKKFYLKIFKYCKWLYAVILSMF